MVSRKTKREEYAFLSLAVAGFDIRSSISLNHEVRDPRYRQPETKIYKQYSAIELYCRNIDPDELPTCTYHFSLYGHTTDQMNPDLSLDDFHVVYDEGIKKYRRRGGVDEPVWDIPRGISVLDKQRGEQHWTTALWLTPIFLSDMIALLTSNRDLYVACHVKKVNRAHWLIGFDLQTENPLES